jgi:microcystin-dependent protein
MRDYATLNAHQKPSVGDTKLSAVNSDHLGWLLCDGRLVNVEEFYFLFDVIGYSFGGSNTQFRLPNGAGRVAGAIGTGQALTFRGLGDSVGEETHQLTVSELASHTHTVTDPGHVHTQTTVNDDFNNSAVGSNGGYPNFTKPSYPPYDGAGSKTWTGTINSNTTGVTIANEGSNVAHNNMQPTLFVGNMFIYSGKPRQGAFPYEYGANVW